MMDSDLLASFGENVIVIDTETTGLGEDNNEVLSLSIVGRDGSVIFNHLIKPQKRVRWPKAQEIHGISPDDVKNEKTLLEYKDELNGYFDGSYLVVGYNVKFDLGMLKASGLNVSRCKSFDVMREFKNEYGANVKLSECARALGYGSFSAHSSLEDAKATAYCFSQLIERDNARASAANNQAGSGCSIPIMALIVFILIFVLIILVVT